MKMFKYLDSLKMIAAVRAAFSYQELHCMCLGWCCCAGRIIQASCTPEPPLHACIKQPQLTDSRTCAVQCSALNSACIFVEGLYCLPLLLLPAALQVLMSCMGSFASIVVLLVLFWLVFSIMGLHVFGGLTLDEPWPNHDDMINSLILNFNVRAEQWLLRIHRVC
jgi:hypothetical protein